MADPQRMNVYHITTPGDWRSAESTDGFRADSLATEGFIHCSFKNQLGGVLERYYKGAGPLLVLEIDPEMLTSEMRIEPSTGGEEYPHIYGPINKDAVIGTARVAAPL